MCDKHSLRESASDKDEKPLPAEDLYQKKQERRITTVSYQCSATGCGLRSRWKVKTAGGYLFFCNKHKPSNPENCEPV